MSLEAGTKVPLSWEFAIARLRQMWKDGVQEGGRSAVEALATAVAIPLAPGGRLVLAGADNAFPCAALAPREPAGAEGGAGVVP